MAIQVRAFDVAELPWQLPGPECGFARHAIIRRSGSRFVTGEGSAAETNAARCDANLMLVCARSSLVL
jgi:hypothetical protein